MSDVDNSIIQCSTSETGGGCNNKAMVIDATSDQQTNSKPRIDVAIVIDQVEIIVHLIPLFPFTILLSPMHSLPPEKSN